MHIHQDSRFISLQKQANNMLLHVKNNKNSWIMSHQTGYALWMEFQRKDFSNHQSLSGLFITIMGIFEKLYQTILNSRLNKFLKIPTEQSTYKKRKGTTFMWWQYGY